MTRSTGSVEADSGTCPEVGDGSLALIEVVEAVYRAGRRKVNADSDLPESGVKNVFAQDKLA